MMPPEVDAALSAAAAAVGLMLDRAHAALISTSGRNDAAMPMLPGRAGLI
jgi:hypothetical protein